MSGTAKFSSGVAWLAIGNWTEQAVNFLVFVLLARLLGAESFGLLAMAAVVVVLSEFLVRESLSEVLISQENPTAQDYNAVFWMLVALGCGLALVTGLAAGPIAAFYHEDAVRPLIWAMMGTVPMIAATAVPVAILRRELRFRDLAIRAVAGVVVGGAVGIGMALTGYGVWSLVGQRVAMIAVNAALAWFNVGWVPGFRTSGAHVARAARFGAQVLGLRASELAATQMPSLVIGSLLGPGPLGLYTVAWRIVELTSFLIVTPLRVAAQPTFAAISRGGGRASDLLLRISAITGVLAFPVFAGLAVVATPLLIVVFGVKWQEAGPVLAIMSAIGAFFCIDKVQQSFCLAAGRAGAVTALSWATVVLGALLAIPAMHWGLAGIAAAVVAGYVLTWPFRFAVAAKVGGIGIGDLVRPYLTPAAVTCCMVAAVMLAERALEPGTAMAALALAVFTGAAVQAALTLTFLRDRVEMLRAFASPSAARAAEEPG